MRWNVWSIASIVSLGFSAYYFAKGEFPQAQYFVLSAILYYLWRN